MADRLSADKNKLDKIKTLIDKLDILQLKSNGERIDIYLMALALGVNAGKRTKTDVKEGLVLESAARGKENALSFINSVAFSELLETKKENSISDTDVAYEITEEYVNTGLDILLDKIGEEKNYDEENLRYYLLSLIDNMIESLDIKK